MTNLYLIIVCLCSKTYDIAVAPCIEIKSINRSINKLSINKLSKFLDTNTDIIIDKRSLNDYGDKSLKYFASDPTKNCQSPEYSDD